MKRRMAWRFTCEHCGKSGASGGHISKHEKYCTKNPARDCRMCRMVGNEPVPMATLLEAVDYEPSGAGWTSDEVLYRELDLTRVRELCGGCPACLLAVVRQCNHPKDISILEENFRWDDERKQWLEDYHDACFITASSDREFDRDDWNERRAKRLVLSA